MHDHATLWGVTRVAPGGLCAFITSRYTADKQNPGFRRALAEEFDLIGMVRLPSTAHKRMAGTPVVTDIIIGRRLGGGERPRTLPETWEQSRPLPLPGTSVAPLVNTYFHANPQHVLGTAQGRRDAPRRRLRGRPLRGPRPAAERRARSEITDRALAAGQRHEPRPAARPVIEILSRRPDGTVTAHPNGTFTQVVHGQDTPLVIKDAREADQARRLVALADALAELISLEASCPEDTDETDAARARMGELYDAYAAAYGPIGELHRPHPAHHIKSLKAVLDRLDFSKIDVPDPEVKLAGGIPRPRRADPDRAVGHRPRARAERHPQGQAGQARPRRPTQLVEAARVRAALTAALAELPQGADAERLGAVFGERISRIDDQRAPHPADARRVPVRPAPPGGRIPRKLRPGHPDRDEEARVHPAHRRAAPAGTGRRHPAKKPSTWC